MAKEVGYTMSNLVRCFERKVVPKSTVYNYDGDGDIRIQCGRIEGHIGTHSFIVNGKRIGEDDEL